MSSTNSTSLASMYTINVRISLGLLIRLVIVTLCDELCFLSLLTASTTSTHHQRITAVGCSTGSHERKKNNDV